MKKRLLSLVLVFTMILTMSITASAADQDLIETAQTSIKATSSVWKVREASYTYTHKYTKDPKKYYSVKVKGQFQYDGTCVKVDWVDYDMINNYTDGFTIKKVETYAVNGLITMFPSNLPLWASARAKITIYNKTTKKTTTKIIGVCVDGQGRAEKETGLN